ncbi:hypothetical protein [Roseibium sp.]|uniref:hypothetical protein n=1 Tax=Roseibium sp. TaxID=1936156 RepID=UPI003BAB399B
MNYRLTTFLVIFFLLRSANLAAQDIDEQHRNFVREDFLYNVVKIKGEKQGYGLIIGREFDLLYVATAFHILPESFIWPDPAPTPVTVKLYRLNETWEALPHRVTGSKEMDLAIIEVYVPRQPRGDGVTPLIADHWRAQVFDSEPRIGDRAELMASVQTIGYAGGNAIVSGVEAGRVAKFEDLLESPGQSGAPISTTRGIVGIYLGTRAQQLVSLPDIAEIVHTEIGPGAYQLVSVPRRPSPTTVCVSIRNGLEHGIAISGPKGLLLLDKDGCAESLSGLHNVTAQYASCEPSTFDVSVEALFEVTVSCGPLPDGVWIASGLGFLEVTPCGPECWNFRANLPQNRGELRGRLEGKLPRLSVEESVLRGRIPVIGSVLVDSSGLHMDLVADGEFLEERFTRP